MFTNYLNENRHELAEKWAVQVRATYPKLGRVKFRERDNEFNDPIGSVLKRDLPVLFDIVATGQFDDDSRLRSHLDPLCRLRSVQEFSASEAIQPIYLLKKVIREELPAEVWSDCKQVAALLAFETRVDRLALHAFDIYVTCRDQLNEIKVDEARRRSELILQHFAEQGKKAFIKEAGESDDTRPAKTNGHGGSGS